MGQRTSIQVRFGQRLRELRRAAGLTQQRLAKKAEMDWKYVGAVERGRRNVTLGLVDRLSNALDVEPLQFFLFGDEGVAPPEKVTAAWLNDRIAACPPDARRLVAGIAALALKLAGPEGSKRS